VGPLSLDAKFVFFTASSQLWIFAIASASDNHDEIYWSVALPLKLGMAFMSSRRFSAVMSSVIGFVDMVEIWYGLRFEIPVFKGDCYIQLEILMNPILWFFLLG
jgi:hypothetical protein